MSGGQGHDDDYLWDRSGPVDAQVARLERLLAPQAWDGAGVRRTAAPAPGPAHAARPRQRGIRPRVVLATAAVLALVAASCTWGLLVHRLEWPDARPWSMTRVEGEARIDGRPLGAMATLAPGSVLETGDDGMVRMRAARIGEVVVGAGSRFALRETRSGRHRVQLEHGRMWARIWAPPGSLGVSTPAGDVLDLGCEFVLQAETDGSGSLSVRSGWVQVDNAWREVLVPQGARVEFGAGGRPGIPYDLGADAAFLAALRGLDAQGRQAEADGELARTLVATSRPRDAISLLVLLQAHPQLVEGPVFDRMAELMPPDVGVTRAAVREQGTAALWPWWDALPYPRIKRWWMQ